MKPSTVIIGIILFAIVTMIIYGWGIVKQKNQTKDQTSPQSPTDTDQKAAQ